MTVLSKCPTPWCESSKVHTTTFILPAKAGEEADVEVEHSCPDCHVRTPRLPIDEANECWNGKVTQ